MKLSAPYVALLAVLGLLVTAGLAFAVERVTTEKVLLSGASNGSLAGLAPNNAAGRMRQPDAEHPVVGSVGADGKITIERGAPGAGSSDPVKSAVLGSRSRDD
jgi:hypothetical protein